ncbi:hypothetical protein SENBN9181_03130 [Salmonella enterica subsp. enterica serovar Typhimurium]|nr:hypothetical protein SENBN9181_03130 [Salmonella enterica subsp. enterica serovar Typhimurium]CAH2856759.1 hypothetical protein SEN049275_14960 [Salmonella enterica subsp. enterica serovar Typhimurium]CAH2869770.1 hypothetical protein SEN081537_32290 [Salmonella enterica subsp. enterica serovar Typhimurium]
MYHSFCTGVIPDREKKHDAEDGCVCLPESLTLVSDSGLISNLFAFYRRPDFGWKSALLLNFSLSYRLPASQNT